MVFLWLKRLSKKNHAIHTSCKWNCFNSSDTGTKLSQLGEAVLPLKNVLVVGRKVVIGLCTVHYCSNQEKMETSSSSCRDNRACSARASTPIYFLHKLGTTGAIVWSFVHVSLASSYSCGNNEFDQNEVSSLTVYE